MKNCSRPIFSVKTLKVTSRNQNLREIKVEEATEIWKFLETRFYVKLEQRKNIIHNFEHSSDLILRESEGRFVFDKNSNIREIVGK